MIASARGSRDSLASIGVSLGAIWAERPAFDDSVGRELSVPHEFRRRPFSKDAPVAVPAWAPGASGDRSASSSGRRSGRGRLLGFDGVYQQRSVAERAHWARSDYGYSASIRTRKARESGSKPARGRGTTPISRIALIQRLGITTRRANPQGRAHVEQWGIRHPRWSRRSGGGAVANARATSKRNLAQPRHGLPTTMAAARRETARATRMAKDARRLRRL